MDSMFAPGGGLPTSMRVVLSQEKQCAIAERPVPAPSPSQLLLRVAWSAVNRADTLQRRGLYPAPTGAPDWLGLEAVGVVVARGGGSASEGGAPALGARVMALLPGGGNAELTSAMRRTLSEAGWPVVSKPQPDAITIEGHVKLAAKDDQTQSVSLRWLVKAPTGKVLGDVKQANDIPAGSLDGGWGGAATAVAEAAATGIFDVVKRYR